MPAPRCRSRSPTRKVQDELLAKAASSFEAFCRERSVPDHHGAGHAQRVLGHVEQALMASTRQLTSQRSLAVRLAALLHDADDRKYFGSPLKKPGQSSSKLLEAFPNADSLLRAAGATREISEEVLRMISWVSCSVNGNSAPPETLAEPELLWPRWADRLEATGEIGIVRCWEYNCEVDMPKVTARTPRPSTEDEVWALASPERFSRYQSSGGASDSMLDHYYDKLLQVSRPPASIVQNAYLEEEMAKRSAPLVEICLKYGETGALPLNKDIIEAMKTRLENDIAPAA